MKDVISVGLRIHGNTSKDMEVRGPIQRNTTPNTDSASTVGITFTNVSWMIMDYRFSPHGIITTITLEVKSGLIRKDNSAPLIRS